MLRRILQVFAVLLLLVLLVLGALAIVLPRYVGTDAFQDDLRARATKALGTDVSWDHVEVGVLPPRVILDSLVLRERADEGDGEGEARTSEARLRAEAVDLRFSLWPLLSRRLEMGSLVIRGVDLVVTRTDEGWILPIELGGASKSAPDAADKGEVSGAAGGADPASATGGALALTLGRVQLADAAIEVRDRTLGREIDWQLSAFGFDATEASEPGRYAMDFRGDLASGETLMGPIEGEGEFRLSTPSAGNAAAEGDLGFEVGVDLEGAEIRPLVSYLPVNDGEGQLSGRLEFLGEAAALSEIRADLQAKALKTRFLGIDVDGAMTLQGVQRPGADSDFNTVIDFASGGRAEIEGTRRADSAIEGKGRLDAVDASALSNMLGDARKASGAITGDFSFATKGEGGLSSFGADLSVAQFGYSDASQRLSEGALDLDLVFTEIAPGPAAGGIELSGGFDGAAQLPVAGARSLAGGIDAKLKLNKSDVAALPFGFTVSALPVGSLTGDVGVRGQLASQLGVAAGSSGQGNSASGSRALAGKLSLDARTGATGPFDLDARWSFKQGGSVSAEGTSTREGVLNLAMQMDALDLALLAPFISAGGAEARAQAGAQAGESDLRVSGRLSGPGRIAGPATTPSRFELDGNIAEGELALGEYEVFGPFGIKLGIDQPLSPRRAGAADLDLTNARVRYEGRFEKKAGIPALLDTKFKPNAKGETEFESRLKLKNLDRIQIQGALGESSRMTLSAAALDLGEAAEFVPLLLEYKAAGKASLSEVAIEQPANGKATFRGSLKLADVSLSVPDAGRVSLSGGVLGEGDRLRTEGLRVVAGEVPIELEGYVEDPFGEGRYAFSGRTVGSPEVNQLLSALTSTADTVFGPLQLEGDFSGVIPDGKSFRETMVGALRFSIGEDVGGRIKGVSLLRTVLGQIPLLGGAILSKPFRGGRSVDDFFSDEFDLMSGEFLVQGGQVEAKTLRVAYEGYEASLSGLMQLTDLSLDMTGDLLLNSDLVAVLVGAVGGDGTDRDPIEIPLARVSNTLSDPKVSMTPRTLAALPKILIQATGLDRIRDGIQEGLGKILKPTLPNSSGIAGEDTSKE